jgi:4'-phosphopantetheinyl transferase
VWLFWAYPGGALPPTLAARLEGLLSPEEQVRHGRFRHARDRTAFLLGRALMRELLGWHAGLAPAAVRLALGTHGRPELAEAQRRGPLSFNLSHTEGLLALAVARAPVGVDVERFATDPEPLSLARQVCSPEEQRALEACGPEERRVRFQRMWALKEAYIKARGLGLSLPLRDMSCGAVLGEGPCFTFGPEVGDSPSRWCFFERQPTPLHRAAVAVAVAPGEAPVLEEFRVPLGEV